MGGLIYNKANHTGLVEGQDWWRLSNMKKIIKKNLII